MIVGHQKQWQVLRNFWENKKIPQSLLFSGPEKIGKKKVALEFVNLIFGQNFNLVHPDFFFIEPKEKEIQIDQIRELISRFSFRPAISPLKVAILDQVHLMNQEAQTCLLKTLEEPRGETIFILITEYPEKLLPTLLSRCQQIKFYLFKNWEIEEFLKSKKIPLEKTEKIIKFSQGRIGRTIEFLSDPQKIDFWEKKIADLEKILKSNLIFRFQYAKNLSENYFLTKETLIIWLGYLRDLFLEKIGKENLVSFKIKENISFLEEILFLISNTNVNLRLALENLMLRL